MVCYIETLLSLLYSTVCYRPESKRDMSTDDNSLPQGKPEYSREIMKGDYEVPQYIQPATAPDTEEGVYEGLD